ncbi:hypothetical protein HKX48_007550 [Thoreauomyces humboldtii]|nr:hypothetical protein HKX48_007550 [Thoreauomyces humboldtii]
MALNVFRLTALFTLALVGLFFLLDREDTNAVQRKRRAPVVNLDVVQDRAGVCTATSGANNMSYTLIYDQQVDHVGAQTACAQRGWTLADITSKLPGETLLAKFCPSNSSALAGSTTWIRSWNGDDYGGSCLGMKVGSNGKFALNVVDCASKHSVLCQHPKQTHPPPPPFMWCSKYDMYRIPAFLDQGPDVTPASCKALCRGMPYLAINQSPDYLGKNDGIQPTCRCSFAGTALPPFPHSWQTSPCTDTCSDGSSCGASGDELVAALYRNYADPTRCVRSIDGMVPAIATSGDAVTPATCAVTCKGYGAPYFAVGMVQTRNGVIQRRNGNQMGNGYALWSAIPTCRCSSDLNPTSPALNSTACGAWKCSGDGGDCGDTASANVLAYYTTADFPETWV